MPGCSHALDFEARAKWWNFLASMHRRIGSRQALLMKFRTDQVGIKRDKSGADPAVTARVGQTSCPDNHKLKNRNIKHTPLSAAVRRVRAGWSGGPAVPQGLLLIPA